MNEKPTHLDLFSGIGGFSLAFEAEGFKTIGFAEIDPYASAVLKKHWPSVINYGDVRNVPTVRCDIITGGFPCQPFSCAGKRRGKEDDRYVWPAMLDVISRCRPAWMLGENVPGILGMALETVLSDLEGKGYEPQTFIIPACAVGAGHLRKRVWIIANATGQQMGDSRQPRQCFDVADAEKIGLEVTQGKNGAAHKKSRCAGWMDTTRGDSTTADTSKAGCEHRSEMQARWKIPRGYSSAGGSWPDFNPGILRVVHGIPNRMDRVGALGNSIVPQVAQIFARAIYQQIKFEN